MTMPTVTEQMSVPSLKEAIAKEAVELVHQVDSDGEMHEDEQEHQSIASRSPDSHPIEHVREESSSPESETSPIAQPTPTTAGLTAAASTTTTTTTTTPEHVVMTPQRPGIARRGLRAASFQHNSPEDLRDDRISLFSEPPADDSRRTLFDELSFGSVPGNLHLSSNSAILRLVQRYSVVDVIRQLASDLAERDAEVGLLRRQNEDRERELRKMLVQCGVSSSDIDKRLMNLTATSVRKPDSLINELMHEAIGSPAFDDEMNTTITEDTNINTHAKFDKNDKDREEDTGTMVKRRAKKSWVGSLFGREQPAAASAEVEDDDADDEDTRSIAESHMSSIYEENLHGKSTSTMLKDKVMSSASSFQDRGPMELNDIVPQNVQPPTLLPSWNDHYGSQQAITDRFGFIYDRNRELRTRRHRDLDTMSIQSVTTSEVESMLPDDKISMRKRSMVDIEHNRGIQLAPKSPTAAKTIVHSQPESSRGSDTENSFNNASSVRMLLAQLTDMHDGMQKAQTARWDEFLRRLNSEKSEVIQNGQLLGVSGTGLLSSDRGKSTWKEFRHLVYGGVPVAYRPKIWGECSGAWTLKEPGKYDSLVNQEGESDAINQIELDLYRTMPYNVFFGGTGPGVVKLRRVLVAYSRLNPEVGYCQGMNVIAAILLLTYATEEDAFWSLVSLVENILPQGYFSPPLLASRADQQVFSKYFALQLPRLADKFDKVGVEVDAITFEWFLSCFTDALPPEVLFRVWDVFLCVEGPVYLFKTALALFKMYESQILKLQNGAEIYGFMKNLVTQPVRVDDVIRHTHIFDNVVTQRDLQRMRKTELRKLAQG